MGPSEIYKRMKEPSIEWYVEEIFKFLSLKRLQMLSDASVNLLQPLS